jgi:hypothetical protein
MHMLALIVLLTQFAPASPASPAQNFTLAVEPGRVSVLQGREATATVRITRTGGFAGEVALSVTGTARDVAAGAENDVITVAVGQNAHVGDHMLTVRGVGGDSTRTAPSPCCSEPTAPSGAPA